MNHVTRREDDSATAESDETHVGPIERRDPQPPAAAAENAAGARTYKRTEDTLRTVALRLDRIAAAYIDSLARISGAR